MQWVTLPLYEDWNYISTVVLEDGSYTVQMTYSERDNSWTMNLSLEQGEDIIVGRKIGIRDAVYVNDKYLTGVFWLEPKYLNANETKLHPSLISKYFNFYYGWGEVANIIEDEEIIRDGVEVTTPIGSIGMFIGKGLSTAYDVVGFDGSIYTKSDERRVDEIKGCVYTGMSYIDCVYIKELDVGNLPEYWFLDATVKVHYTKNKEFPSTLHTVQRVNGEIILYLTFTNSSDECSISVSYGNETISQKFIYNPVRYEVVNTDNNHLLGQSTTSVTEDRRYWYE